MKYNVLSPDGFSIHFEDTYRSKEEALEKAQKWAKKFEGQGYYSSVNYGRIPVPEILDYCKLVEVPENIIKLKSVGCFIDTIREIIYPELKNGEPDFDNSTLFIHADEEFKNSLDHTDIEILKNEGLIDEDNVKF